VRRGSLTVVGTGIRVPLQVTAEARSAIRDADEVLYLSAEPLAGVWIRRLNKSARSLGALYRPGEPRAETYARIADAVLTSLRRGREICAAFYGHPGVLVRPGHEVVRRARAEGFEATMLPAVSAEDCLFADLGVDPGQTGCQSYEATDFLLRRRAPDPAAALILWQIGVLGNIRVTTTADTSRLPVLVDHLLGFYSTEHEVVVYEASPYAVCGPRVERVPLSDLAATEIAALATLYVPPASTLPIDPEVAARLDLSGVESRPATSAHAPR